MVDSVSGVGSKTVSYFDSRVLVRCLYYMTGMLNDSQLAAVNDVTDLLPHACLDRGTWDVTSTPLGGVPNVVVFAFKGDA